MRAASFSFACSLISPLPASDRCLSPPWLLLGQVTLSHAFLFLPRGRAGCSPSAAHPCLPGVNAAPPFPHPSFPIFPRFLPRVCHERPSSSRCLTNRDPALHHAAVRAPALAGAAVQLLLPPRRCLARAPHVPSLFFSPLAIATASWCTADAAAWPPRARTRPCPTVSPRVSPSRAQLHRPPFSRSPSALGTRPNHATTASAQAPAKAAHRRHPTTARTLGQRRVSIVAAPRSAAAALLADGLPSRVLRSATTAPGSSSP